MVYKKLTKISARKWKLFERVFSDTIFHLSVSRSMKEFEGELLDKNTTLNKGIHIFDNGSISFEIKDKNNRNKRVEFSPKQINLVGSGAFFSNDTVEYTKLESTVWNNINRQVNNVIKEYRGPGSREWETLTKDETLEAGLFYNRDLKEIVIPIRVSGEGPWGGWSSHISNYNFSTNELNLNL